MTLRRSGHVEAERRAALLTFALATCALVVVGTVMLGFTSAAHTATESHVDAELAIEASGGVPVHDGAHALTGMQVAGVCAAVLAALAAVALGGASCRRISSTATQRLRRPGSWRRPRLVPRAPAAYRAVRTAVLMRAR